MTISPKGRRSGGRDETSADRDSKREESNGREVSQTV